MWLSMISGQCFSLSHRSTNDYLSLVLLGQKISPVKTHRIVLLGVRMDQDEGDWREVQSAFVDD